MLHRYEIFSAAIASMYHDIQWIERVEMAKYGLKGPHAQCLLAMSRYPDGLTSVRLCEICDKDKAAVSRTVSELAEAGLLVIAEKNGVRYRAMLYLTEAGQAAAKAVCRRAELAVAQAGQGLTDAQREVFYDVLAKIAGNLHAICKNGLREEE